MVLFVSQAVLVVMYIGNTPLACKPRGLKAGTRDGGEPDFPSLFFDVVLSTLTASLILSDGSRYSVSHFLVSSAIFRDQGEGFLKLAVAQIELSVVACIHTVDSQYDLPALILPH